MSDTVRVSLEGTGRSASVRIDGHVLNRKVTRQSGVGSAYGDSASAERTVLALAIEVFGGQLRLVAGNTLKTQQIGCILNQRLASLLFGQRHPSAAQTRTAAKVRATVRSMISSDPKVNRRFGVVSDWSPDGMLQPEDTDSGSLVVLGLDWESATIAFTVNGKVWRLFDDGCGDSSIAIQQMATALGFPPITVTNFDRSKREGILREFVIRNRKLWQELHANDGSIPSRHLALSRTQEAYLWATRTAQFAESLRDSALATKLYCGASMVAAIRARFNASGATVNHPDDLYRAQSAVAAAAGCLARASSCGLIEPNGSAALIEMVRAQVMGNPRATSGAAAVETALREIALMLQDGSERAAFWFAVLGMGLSPDQNLDVRLFTSASTEIVEESLRCEDGGRSMAGVARHLLANLLDFDLALGWRLSPDIKEACNLLRDELAFGRRRSTEMRSVLLRMHQSVLSSRDNVAVQRRSWDHPTQKGVQCSQMVH